MENGNEPLQERRAPGATALTTSELLLNDSSRLTSAPAWLAGHVLNPFVNSLAIEPYNAAANVVNTATQHELMGKQKAWNTTETEFLSPGWLVQSVSSGLGMVVPYVLAGKGAGMAMRSAESRFAANTAASSFLKSEIAAQVTGAAMLDFARDTREGETHLGNAAGGAAAFYIFAKGNALNTVESFWKRQGIRAGVGSLGGLAHVTTSSIVAGEGLPGLEKTAQAVIGGATLNVALPPTQHALSKGAEAIVKHPKVESLYYDTKWKLSEGYTEARRATYSFLNKHDLRHPVQKLESYLFPARVEAPARPTLTAENNPIKAFESELPEYFKGIDTRRDAMDQAGRDTRRDLYDQMNQYKTDFIHKLLTFWHGTSELPGIKSFTDAELQPTSGVSQERIAAIREAMTRSAKRDYPRADALTKAMGDLANIDVGGSNSDYSLAGMAYAKERFFGYSEDALSRKMSMPRGHFIMDHGYGTPVEWMPFEPTAQHANLFHGSVSNSLDSVLTERVMLSARELRLRGITQNTGESATEEFPRRAISLTRDFNEAWAYHRHSPEYLTGFPMVFGVSKEVAPRMRSAGMLEPGELLIDKLGVGNSLLTKLGLKSPDITHIYVPDSQIDAVTRQLAGKRINGVKVVGLNELEAPPWKPEPIPQAEDW